jgi:hypothetical protein
MSRCENRHNQRARQAPDRSTYQPRSRQPPSRNHPIHRQQNGCEIPRQQTQHRQRQNRWRPPPLLRLRQPHQGQPLVRRKSGMLSLTALSDRYVKRHVDCAARMIAQGTCGYHDRGCGYQNRFAGRQGPVRPPYPIGSLVTYLYGLENSTRKYTQYPQLYML